ncbi:MAG: pullulanase/glycogen debranching enzyme [Lentimonas sp.]|jgi:pullulanase/glycogen debranching enzyme
MSQTIRRIVHAYWESEDSCVVVLTADWTEGTILPPLALKSAGLEVGELERLNKAEIGPYYGYYRDGQSYVFVLYLDNYPWLSEAGSRVYLAASFNGWGEAVGQSEWELLPGNRSARGGINTLSIPVDSIPEAESFRFKFVTEKREWLDVPGTALNAVQSSDGIVDFEFNPHQSGLHIFRFQTSEGYVQIGNERVVWSDGEYEESYELFDLERLLSAATDLPLGAVVENNRTTFRLFAPRASEVQLAYGFAADQSDATFVSMHCIDGVTWEVVFHESLVGACYSFRVKGENNNGTTDFDASFAVLDPYAKACLGSCGPGVVVDPQRFKKVKRLYKAPAWQDLVILEGHIRDLAAQAPMELMPEEREGFTGLRKWIESEGSYLRELGVNAVELQPIQQIGDSLNKGYHWGYMSVNYFSPESSYALEPESASQVEEFRDLVRTFHDQGMAVIVDVVYNHVGEPYHLSYVDKHYYFHLDENNELMNWSGCGNDLRCDTPMARRLIIESLKHFVEVYDVDGFRFDLAELIGIEVLNEIEIELRKIKPSIILIAEPWSFRGHIQHELKESDFASWNDGFRESIAKYVCGEGTSEMIQYYLSGSPHSSRFAAQTINYTESHDDHCWIDRITEQPEQDGSSPTWLDQRRTHLMASVLFASLGVPMLAEGQDFMRSKLGIANTYKLGDVNALNYERRLLYSGTHAYFRDWIQFRLSTFGQALRYDGPLKEGYLKFFANEGSSAVVALFNADRSVKAKQLIFAVNPNAESTVIECDAIYLNDALQIADHERFDVSGLRSALIETDGGVVRLPPFTSGLWLVS